MQLRRWKPTNRALDDRLADAERDESAAMLAIAREQMRPRPVFARELEDRLAARMAGVPGGGGDAAASPSGRERRLGSARLWPTTIALATATLFVLAVGLGVWWLGRPAPVSADAVLHKTLATAADPATAGVRSFHMTIESSSAVPAAIAINRGTVTPSQATQTHVTTEELWGVLPDRWRTEYRMTSPLPFSADRVDVSGSGSDGMTEWSYDTWREPGRFQDTVEVRIGALRAGVRTPLPIFIRLSDGGGTPGTLVQEASPCYHPQLAGEATVAGRAAYVIDLGPFLCPASFALHADGTTVPGPVTPAAEQGRHTMWIDKATYFMLKSESANPDGTLQSRQAVTAITYNGSIPTSVFTYSLPPDVTATTITDRRPQPYTLPSHPPFITDERLPPGLVGPPRQKP